MPFGRGSWHSVSFRREGVVLAPGSSRCGGSELRMSSKRGARPLPRTKRVRRRGPAGRRSGLTQLRAPPDQSHCASGHGASNGCCLRLPSWRHPQDPRKYPCVRWGVGPNASIDLTPLGRRQGNLPLKIWALLLLAGRFGI